MNATARPPRPCKRCRRPALAGLAYCANCRKRVLKELMDSGYLDRLPWRPPDRTDDSRENTTETKFGPDR